MLCLIDMVCGYVSDAERKELQENCWKQCRVGMYIAGRVSTQELM